ncbi:MAG: phosphatidylglycerol lysyltransferase domain-containing protein [Synergistaceae bacterium]|jgi:hypothetical protein|nr:phosphatidylglycerol lysyltransferase domain-containing protein [Synergistaceae bacterium]
MGNYFNSAALSFPEVDEKRFRIFDSFAPLDLSTKAIYDACAAKIPEALTSPSYFQCLYAWNFTAVSEYKILCGYLCVVTHDTLEGTIFAQPPIGLYSPEAFEETIDALYRKFIDAGLACVFREVPCFMLPYFSCLPLYDVHIDHDVDWSDYMFTKEDFAAGITKRSSREAIRNFEKKCRPSARELSSSDANEAVAVTKRYYCNGRNCSECFCGCEVTVVSRLMGAYESLDLAGIVVETGGEPVGFGIVCFQKDTIYFISKKVKRSLKGLNEFLNVELMNRFGGGSKYVNYSEDMGNEGLRFYKSRLGKYRLSHRHVVSLTRRDA